MKNSVKIHLLTLLLLFNIVIYSQKNDTAYIHTFGGIQNDFCKQVQPTPDSGYIMIGTTNSFGPGQNNFYAIKTDSLCNFQWSKCYGGPLNQVGYSVATTLDNGFAFVGYTNSFGYGGYDVYLVKTDSKGNEQWHKTYGGPNWDFGYSIQQLSDSGYVICGLTYSYGSVNGSLYVIRTDKKGDTLWTKAIGDSGYTLGNAVAVREDSLYIIAGATTSYGIGDTNAILIQINDKGAIEWIRLFGDSTNKSFNSIHLTPDGGFIMYGSTDSVPNTTKKDSFEFECMIKTDSLGNLLLNPPGLLPSPKSGFGSDARQLEDGTFLTLGSNGSYGAGEYDFRTFHLSSGGWLLEGPTFGGTKNEFSGSIAIGKNGDVIFAGSSDSYPLFSCGAFDIFMIRLTHDNILPFLYDTIVHRFIDTTEAIASVHQIKYNIDVNIFPNPLITSVTILIQGYDFEKYTFNMFNMKGQNVLNNFPLKNIGHGQAVALLSRGNLVEGEYIYEIRANGNTKVASGKIIVE